MSEEELRKKIISLLDKGVRLGGGANTSSDESGAELLKETLSAAVEGHEEGGSKSI